ncbi:cobalt-zinc-cadmium efflux system outer membrane protein [Nitrosomonas oligotropha]|uniref:Cobalt-zinc-cadmium efflux system outer membrane protein n=1 Tax=Nitrosomonas oligotropha TaxID=42354 RepID=A0A2T5HYX6_9PROT|nr:TolC family protein [Nitrosomonas oligotropha]PTQ76784.1 cobalt-zinc-cadmium efflux system outer membrane protein [Nitrosomonas oligotropha]
MKLSDLFIALRYLVAPKLRGMLLGSIILLSFSAQIESAGADSFNKLSGGKNDYLANSINSDDKNDLTLRDAINLALLQNPELAAFSKEMRALEGITLQAGLLRNPELSVNVENIGNIQKLSGDINSAHAVAQEVVQQLTTIRIGQLIELGGKRAARVSAALLGEDLAAKDYEIRRVEIIARVANVYTEVLAAQERLRLAEEIRQVAQIVVNSVTERVQGGKVAPIEETRVKVGLSTTRIEYEQAQRDLISARRRLALLWDNSSPQFNRALGNLEILIPPPSFQMLEERVLNNPMALRAMKNIEQRKALLEVEQTRRIPNLTINAGVVHHALLGGNTAVASVMIPLPLFDRNQGNIKDAYQRVDKAVDEQAAMELRLKTELAQSYEAMSAAWNEINILRDEVLPGAKSAFHVMRRGYELGKFGLLEMLDAQRILFQNQVLYVRALANYQRLVNDIERLIAGPIDSIKPNHEINIRQP